MLRLVTGLGIALALTACAGRLPATGPSDATSPPASIEPATASPSASSAARPIAAATATPATFSFDPSAVESELSGVDRQLNDINGSITATDTATAGEGQQP